MGGRKRKYILIGPLEQRTLEKIDMGSVLTHLSCYNIFATYNTGSLDDVLKHGSYDLILLGIMLKTGHNPPEYLKGLNGFNAGMEILYKLDSGYYPDNDLREGECKVLFITGSPSQKVRDLIRTHPSCTLILDDQPSLSAMYIAGQIELILKG